MSQTNLTEGGKISGALLRGYDVDAFVFFWPRGFEYDGTPEEAGQEGRRQSGGEMVHDRMGG
jgi:hypothetical protein